MRVPRQGTRIFFGNMNSKKVGFLELDARNPLFTLMGNRNRGAVLKFFRLTGLVVREQANYQLPEPHVCRLTVVLGVPKKIDGDFR
jgi:hypothetical protein